MGLVVAALGGNALLRRGDPLDPDRQREAAQAAAAGLARVALRHDLVVTHGNGPQVGLLARREAPPGEGGFGLDVLDAETEGMIGYVLEQELANALAGRRQVTTVLTRVAVDPDDPAFAAPSKPIGRVYARAEADRLAAEHGWSLVADGSGWRRVVASPRPVEVLAMPAIRSLVSAGFVVISGGGGGIPVVVRDGRSHGVPAVIDKDLTSAAIAIGLAADVLAILTDQPGVWDGFGTAGRRLIRRAGPDVLEALGLPPGTMGPKIEAVGAFVRATGGRAAIGSLDDILAVVEGAAGTQVEQGGGLAHAP